MNTQKMTTNVSTKAKPQTQDYISQIKKETVGQKENKNNEINDLNWDKNVSDDEEETIQTAKKGIIAQGKVGSDKPKKLRDLFANEPAKPKSKRTQPADQTKEKQKLEGQVDTGSKPKFFNSAGVPIKEADQTPVQKTVVTKKYDKEETARKFTNTKDIFSKVAEENAKIKPPTKDYLDAEVKVTYKEEPAMEKPKFMNKLAENVTEPRYAEIDKSEDKIAERNLNLENTYTEPKEDKEPYEKKPYEKKPYENRPYEKKPYEKKPYEKKPYQKKEYQKDYVPRTYEKKKEEDEVDSDGFTLVNSEAKKRVYNNEERPYKKQYRDNKEYKGKNNFVRKSQGDKDNAKEEGEANEETKGENVEKTEEQKEETTGEAKNVKNVSAKAVVKISTQGAKSLKDLF